MAKKTAEQIAAQDAAKAYKQSIKDKQNQEKLAKQQVKQFLAQNPELARRMGADKWGGYVPESMESLKSQYARYFDPNYEQPDYGTYGDPNTGEQIHLTSNDPNVQAIADIYKKAYQDWRAANKGKYGALYTQEEMKKYLPKGFKDPGNWTKSVRAGLDLYDYYGNIIPNSMVSRDSGLGDAIQRGQYVAPNVMAASMGAPQSEINRLLGITSGLGTDYWNNVSGKISQIHSPVGQPGSNLLPPFGATTTPTVPTPGSSTNAAAGTAVDNAAKNLANVSQPKVPNFIQPYQNVNKGFKQAFGEQDLNW